MRTTPATGSWQLSTLQQKQGEGSRQRRLPRSRYNSQLSRRLRLRQVREGPLPERRSSHRRALHHPQLLVWGEQSNRRTLLQQIHHPRLQLLVEVERILRRSLSPLQTRSLPHSRRLNSHNRKDSLLQIHNLLSRRRLRRGHNLLLVEVLVLTKRNTGKGIRKFWGSTEAL